MNGSVFCSDGIKKVTGIDISPDFILIQGSSGLNYQLTQISNLWGSVTTLDIISVLLLPIPNASENLFLAVTGGISPQGIQAMDKQVSQQFLPTHILTKGLIRLVLGSPPAVFFTIWVKESCGKRFIRLPVNP